MIQPKNTVFCSNHTATIHAEFRHPIIPQGRLPPSLNRVKKDGFNPIGLEPLLGQAKQLRMLKRGEVITAQFYDKSTRQILKPIWQIIQRIIGEAILLMVRPIAVHVRFTLVSDADSPSKVMQSVVEQLKRAGSTCRYIWVREVRPEDYEGLTGDYEHYHTAILFDKKASFVGTIIKTFALLKARHWIESFHLSRESVWCEQQNKRREKIKVHKLSNPDGVADFEKHTAYLAKTETKQHCEGKRTYGSSRAVTPQGYRLKVLTKIS